jgi:hypothetical protein
MRYVAGKRDIYRDINEMAQNRGRPITAPKHGLYMDIGRITIEQDHFIDTTRALKVLALYYGVNGKQGTLKEIGAKFDRSDGWVRGTVMKILRYYILALRVRGEEK